MQSLFRTWLKLTLAHPAMVLLLALLSLVVSVAVTATRLEFSTDRTQLLDPSHPIQQGYKAFREEFGGNSDLVVLVVGQPAQVRAAVDQLGQALTQEPAFFQDVLFRLEMPEVARHSLYFLSYRDLKTLEEQAQAVRGWWSEDATGPPDPFQALESRRDDEVVRLLEPVAATLAKAFEGALASLETRGQGDYTSPLPVFVPDSERLAGAEFRPGQTVFYNTVGSDGACMLLARPTDPSGSFSSDSATIARLREIVDRVSLDHPAVNFLVSGEPVINTDEMVGARDDAIKCSLTALVLVSTLLALAFGDLLRPLCAVVSLLVGLSWSFAFAALTVGTLNLLTVHFATILVGLCMTFAIQLLSHYQDLRSQSSDLPPAEVLENAVCETGLQTLIGAVATAVAFWTLHFTDFRAAGELGLITGTGVLLIFGSIWTLFPVLVHLVEGKRSAPHPLRIPGFAPLGRKLNDYPGWVLMASLVLTLYSATWINRVPFNYNLLSLQAEGSDSVRVEHLLQTLGYSSLYAVVTTPTVEQAQALTKKLQALSTVSHVESLASLLPNDVDRKREPIANILKSMRRIETTGLPEIDDFRDSGQPYRDAEQLLYLRAQFQRYLPRLRAVVAALSKSPEQARLTTSVKKMEGLLEQNSPGPLEAGLRVYEQRLYAELEEYQKFLAQQRPNPPDVLASLPPALRSRSVSEQGNFSLRIFPRADVWQREALQKFVTQLEKTAPGVTGTPLLIFYYLEELRLAYSSAGTNALLVIAVLLLIYYRSFVQAGLALFPKLLGVVWMIGIMGVCGVSFNAANFLALPITLGIGLVFGVNILSQCRQDGVSGLYASATGGGVLLSGLVATVGFASFAMANHEGVASFGFVMAAGVGANMLTSLGTLPAVLGFWKKHRSTPGADTHR